jgi:putative ABC transport system ATP-binding protein
VIRITKLRFQYPHTPFRLEIPEWQVAEQGQVAIVGPSGSGKTTLLHLLAGILTPQSGSIEMGPIDVTQLSDAQRRDFRASSVGLVFQRFELLDYLPVAENILLPYLINHRLRIDANVRDRLRQLAQRAGIESLLNRPVQRLSQGEQQRVAICRALINRPQWVLADEPTGNLDPINKQKIVDLLREQAQESQATLIMVTHDVTLVSQFDQHVDFRRWCGQDSSAPAETF